VGASPPRQTFLVHGEAGVFLDAFRDTIGGQFDWPVIVAAYQQSFDLSE